jgi:hypothetical protein
MIGAQPLETLLGLVLQVLQAGSRWQRFDGTRNGIGVAAHAKPSFLCARRPQVSGRKSG